MIFLVARINDMHHYLVPVLDKSPAYIILHIGVNDVIDIKASEIVKKLLKLKEFVQN